MGGESRFRGRTPKGEIQTIRGSQQFTTKGILEKNEKTKQKMLIAEDASKKLTTTKSLFRPRVPFPPICNREVYMPFPPTPLYIYIYSVI